MNFDRCCKLWFTLIFAFSVSIFSSCERPFIQKKRLRTERVLLHPGGFSDQVNRTDLAEWRLARLATFKVTKQEMFSSNVEIVLCGVAGEFSLFVNDSLLLACDGSAGSYRVPVRGVLKNGENDLRLVFSESDGFRGQTGPVVLDVWNDAALRSVSLSSSPGDRGAVVVSGRVEVDVRRKGRYDVVLTDDNGRVYFSHRNHYQPGVHTVEMAFGVNHPKFLLSGDDGTVYPLPMSVVLAGKANTGRLDCLRYDFATGCFDAR